MLGCLWMVLSGCAPALHAQASLPSAPTLRAALLYSAAPIAPPRIATPDSTRRTDRWLAYDKVQHFTFSFLWTLGSQYALVNKGTLTEREALPLSVTSSAAIGVAKELYDWRRGARHDFSHRDLVADGLGILCAVGFILL